VGMRGYAHAPDDALRMTVHRAQCGAYCSLTSVNVYINRHTNQLEDSSVQGQGCCNSVLIKHTTACMGIHNTEQQ